MEENKKLESGLYKVRSYSSCLHEGFKLFAGNMLNILKNTWMVILLVSLCLSVAALSLQPVVRMVLGIMTPEWIPHLSEIIFSILSGGLFFLFSVFGSFYVGQLVVLMREYDRLGVFPRVPVKEMWSRCWQPALKTLQGVLGYWILVGCLSGCFHYFAGISWWTWFWDVLLILGIFIPYSSWVIHLLMGDGTVNHKHVIRQAYENWGAWAAVFLVSGIFVGITLLFFLLPSGILVFARIESFLTVLGGDTTDLPSGFVWMQFVTTTISFMLSLFIMTLMFLPLVFQYGSLQQKQKELDEYELEQQKINP